MKKHLRTYFLNGTSVLIFLVCMFSLLFTNVVNAQSTGIALYTSIAIDNAGTPYVAFEDGANGNKATVMKFNGSNWETVGNAGFSATGVTNTSLAIDGSGTPFVAYRGSNGATVMKFNGSNWETVGIDGFSAGQATYTSLTINGNGTPYVAYQDEANDLKATVMKFNGSNWETVGNAGFSSGTADFTSLAFDLSGAPYVAYMDGANSSKATVMKFNGSNWETVGNAGFSDGNAYNTSLALDGSGTPFVAFVDNGARVMKFNGNNWETVGNGVLSASFALETSLAIDGSGTPYVAYMDNAIGFKATVKKFNGSNWETVGNVEISEGQAPYNTLALDGSGTPYLAYQDLANGQKATVMKLNGSNWVKVGGNSSCNNPTDGGSIAGNQTGCSGFDPGLITSTALPTGQTGTLEYKWQQSTTSSSSGFSDIGGSNSATYDPPSGLTVTTWYKRLARVACKPDWTGAAESNALTMTINPTPTVDRPYDQIICNNFLSAPVFFTGTVSGTTNNWTNDNPSIGLAASGTGDISSFTAINPTNTQAIATITVTPTTGNPGSDCTGTSQTFTITVNPDLTASVSIDVTSKTVCEGTSVIFTATPTNGGPSPSYQWYKGVALVGINSPSYSYTPTDGDVISVVMTSNMPTCLVGSPATSNSITMSVSPPLTASVSIYASASSVCEGTPVIFTATPTNGGLSPAYQWYKGATQVGTNSTSYSYTPSDGDVISVVMTSDLTTCLVGSPATSNSITMSVKSIPSVNDPADQIICNNFLTAPVFFTGAVSGTTYNWTNNNPSIGLAAIGSGNIASFTATNTTNAPVTSTITVTPDNVSGSFAYIPNGGSNSVSVIDLVTNTIVANIPVGSTPQGVSVSPDGSRLYVTNYSSNNVSVINTSTNAVVATIPVGSNPIGISVSTDGSRVYVANLGSDNVSVINTSINAVDATITVGSGPNGITVSPDGSRVYVANAGSNNVSVINTSTNGVVATIPVGSSPYEITISPDGSRVYVANANSNNVSVIKNSTNGVVATIQVGTNPFGLTVSPDGSRIFVSNSGSNDVSVINVSTNAVVATIPLGTNPNGITVSPDGNLVYVVNYNSNNVSVINASSNAVVATIPGFNGPSAFGNFIASSSNCSGIPKSFTITVNPSVSASVTIAANAISVCDGTSVIFTATPTNGGSSPSYQWYNGANPVGTDSPSYSYTPTDGDVISVVMTSDMATCLVGSPATSNSITMSVKSIPSVNDPADQIICNNFLSAPVFFTGGVSGTTYNWTNNNPGIGLAANGSGDIASFTATNATNAPVTATVTVTPTNGIVSGYAYISNYDSNTISVINISTNTIVATIPVGGQPFGVSVSPDGSRVYVTNMGSLTVSVINTVTNTVIATIPVESGAFGLSVSPDGNRVYVANRSANTVSVINTTTNTVIATIAVGSGPSGLCVSPDGNKLYVANQQSNSVSVISISTNTVMDTFILGSSPCSVCVSPDGKRLYVTHPNANNVSVINTLTNTIISTISVGLQPIGISINPIGTQIYVTNSSSSNVSVINSSTNSIVSTITVGTDPQGISVSSDGSLVYVANTYSNNVSVINTSLSTVITTLNVNNGPAAFGNFITGNNSTNCSGASQTFTITVNPSVSASVTIAANVNPVCANTPVNFTATPTNEGTSPIYQWKVNGTNAGSNSPTFSYTPSNGDLVRCELTSNYPCSTGNPIESNVLTMTVNTMPTATISYAGTPFDPSDGLGLVTLTGNSGGTFSSSPAGLTINATTGTIIPLTSKVGTYVVSYKVTPVGGCGTLTATTNVVVNRLTTLTYTGITSNVQYGFKANLSATLKAGTSAVSGQTILFTVGSQSVSANTNATGVASANLVITQSPVSVSVITTYSGNATYRSSSDNDPFTIVSKPLTATLKGTVSKIYDGTISATLLPGNYTLTGVLTGENVVLNNTSSTYDNKNIGTLKNVTASGLFLSGTSAGNYSLPTTTISALIGSITKVPLTVTAQSDTKVYDGTVNSVIIPIVGPLQVGDAISTSPLQKFNTISIGTGKTLTASGLVINDGNNGSNYNVKYVTNVTGVILAPGIAVSFSPAGSIQYSDMITLTASVNGLVPTGASVTFNVGGQVMRDAGNNTNIPFINGVANLSVPLIETKAGVMTPGSKVVTAIFNNFPTGYTKQATTLTPLIITPEDAIIQWNPTTTSSNGVTVSANIMDISFSSAYANYDLYPGDIRKATVRFVNRNTGANISGSLPVTLINTADTRRGKVSYTIPSGLNTWTVGIVVEAYYSRDNASDNINVSNIKSAGIPIAEETFKQIKPIVKTYPNPFTDQLTIEFSNVTDAHAKLEIYSITGAKLETLFNGNILGGELNTVEYSPNLISSQMVFYQLIMGDKTYIGKVLYNERK